MLWFQENQCSESSPLLNLLYFFSQLAQDVPLRRVKYSVFIFRTLRKNSFPLRSRNVVFLKLLYMSETGCSKTYETYKIFTWLTKKNPIRPCIKMHSRKSDHKLTTLMPGLNTFQDELRSFKMLLKVFSNTYVHMEQIQGLPSKLKPSVQVMTHLFSVQIFAIKLIVFSFVFCCFCICDRLHLLMEKVWCGSSPSSCCL